MKFSKKYLIVPAVLILIASAFTAWLYAGQVNESKERIFKNLPMPAAYVGKSIVNSQDLYARFDLAKKIPTPSGVSDADLKNQLYDQLIETSKLDLISSQNSVSVAQGEIDAAYDSLVKEYQNGDAGKFAEQLQTTFGLTPDQFKNEVLKIDVLKSNLNLWFNKQENLNKEGYAKINEAQQKLAEGQKFEDLVKLYSEDEVSRDLGGESGFVEFDAMLPEFKTALKDAELNKPIKISSRYGIHLIEVTAKDENGENGKERFSLRQIFVKPADFLSWYNSELQNIKSKKLLKF